MVTIEEPPAQPGAEVRLVVQVAADGTVALDGRPMNDAELLEALEVPAEGATVVIWADRATPHERVVELMEVVRASGIRKVSLDVR